jgi:DNA-directed RNA polymerase III subunit RPC2
LKKYNNRTADRIVAPDMNTSAKGGVQVAPRHQIQDRDGIAAVGEMIRPGDIYINKQSPINTRDNVMNPQAMPDS